MWGKEKTPRRCRQLKLTEYLIISSTICFFHVPTEDASGRAPQAIPTWKMMGTLLPDNGKGLCSVVQCCATATVSLGRPWLEPGCYVENTSSYELISQYVAWGRQAGRQEKTSAGKVQSQEGDGGRRAEQTNASSSMYKTGFVAPPISRDQQAGCLFLKASR